MVEVSPKGVHNDDDSSEARQAALGSNRRRSCGVAFDRSRMREQFIADNEGHAVRMGFYRRSRDREGGQGDDLSQEPRWL